jgi:hypothetical protein
MEAVALQRLLTLRMHINNPFEVLVWKNLPELVDINQL